MTTNQTQTWQPNENDHLIYDWVKMQGKTQAEVGSLLKIHQGTVSRVIQRYERWLAHMQDRDNGRLDPAERLAAQRQLTYDRNELILASCLRIAKDMEGSLDGTRSTVTRSPSDYSKENEIRTTHFTIDRTSAVCRYLRLAHRINMEQDKLAVVLARMEDPIPEPLTDEQLANQARQAALDDAEISSGTLRVLDNGDHPPAAPAATHFSPQRELGDAESPESISPDLVTRVPPGDALTRGSPLVEVPTASSHKEDAPVPTLNLEPGTEISVPTPVGAHHAHSTDPPIIAPTAGQPCTCVLQLESEKISVTRMTPGDEPARPHNLELNQREGTGNLIPAAQSE